MNSKWIYSIIIYYMIGWARFLFIWDTVVAQILVTPCKSKILSSYDQFLENANILEIYACHIFYFRSYFLANERIASRRSSATLLPSYLVTQSPCYSSAVIKMTVHFFSKMISSTVHVYLDRPPCFKWP